MSKNSIALVTGCFDLLHYGHLKFLKFAKSKTDHLIVGLESDQFLKENKGPHRPLFSQDIRRFCLKQLKSVDQIISLPTHPNYLKILQILKIDTLIISSNDKYYKQKHQICQQLGIKLIVFPRLKKYSTSKIIDENIVASR